MTAKPLISIIISAYNAENKINKCLSALINQTYKPIEIIVVDNGSTDDTGKIIKELMEKNNSIKLFRRENKSFGPAPAKNLASKKAKGNILVFVDSDEYPRQDYIEKLTKPIREGKAKTSIGAWVLAQPRNPWARCRFKDTSELRHHAINSGVFRAIKKDFFLKLGGFNEEKGFSDDRLETGVGRARVGDAIFYHDTESSFKEIFSKQIWIGSSIMANPKPAKFWIKLILGIILFGFFVASFWINLWLTLGILILGFIPGILKTFRKIFFYKEIRLLFYYPVYSIAYSMAIPLGFLESLVEKIFKSF